MIGTMEQSTEDSLGALSSVLDEIRSAHARSRSEIVARTGLSRGTVAQRVNELRAIGLVVENQVGPSTGGRPPRQISFRSDAAMFWSRISVRRASMLPSPISMGGSSVTVMSRPTSPPVPSSAFCASTSSSPS